MDSDNQISSTQSLISLIVYLSGTEALLTSLKSKTAHMPWPCGLGTKKIGELKQDWLTSINKKIHLFVVSVYQLYLQDHYEIPKICDESI